MRPFEGASVVITGGTGSLAQVLAGRLLSGAHGTPRRIVIFSRDEAKQHALRIDLKRGHVGGTTLPPGADRTVEFRLGDIRDPHAVGVALRGADIVVNAAALKQVPACEYFPYEAVQTNVGGAENIVRVIREQSLPVQTVVGISTDKACLPANVMGMTKALQERVIVAANLTMPATRFVCVRYGNFLASRGSVVPVFQDQIRRGGPVTITSPDMTRFLLPVGRAVDTIVAAVEQATAGETYVPRAEAARIVDVARALVGDRGTLTLVTGVRPGEKIHEVLVSAEEGSRTYPRAEYLVIQPMLPELSRQPEPGAPLAAEYTSQDSLLAPDEVRALLEQHDLLVPGETREGELLR